MLDPAPLHGQRVTADVGTSFRPAPVKDFFANLTHAKQQLFTKDYFPNDDHGEPSLHAMIVEVPFELQSSRITHIQQVVLHAIQVLNKDSIAKWGFVMMCHDTELLLTDQVLLRKDEALKLEAGQAQRKLQALMAPLMMFHHRKGLSDGFVVQEGNFGQFWRPRLETMGY